MKQEHQWRARYDARQAECKRRVVRSGDRHRVARHAWESQARPEQVREVADGRVRSPDRVQVITHTWQMWEATVQAGSRNGNRVPALTQSPHRLVRVSVAPKVVWKEQVPGKQNRLRPARHAVSRAGGSRRRARRKRESVRRKSV